MKSIFAFLMVMLLSFCMFTLGDVEASKIEMVAEKQEVSSNELVLCDKQIVIVPDKNKNGESM